MVAKEFSDLEKQFPAEPVLFVVSHLNSLISDQINSCVRKGINACKVDMEMITTSFADEAYKIAARSYWNFFKPYLFISFSIVLLLVFFV